ncbi:hypothetical protein [Kitasatospora kifunensis]|uniref:Secreted protein n=1 Tax=Kitasatospora kifunensis TaxID=58351 RepID=A0A7W7R932_KITKI|nr:hypothetical protein [Kitasatospora kifunensis]MBB4927697.1 hypothetical protein [Kitasatospora kifunensis]
MNRISLLPVPVALAALVFACPLASAAAPMSAAAATSSCSAVVPYGKQICLSVSPQTVTATMVVQSGGRGWFGQIEIDGPTGQLLRTGDHTLPAPANWANSYPATGPGRYCAIDWRWDVYHQDYFEENSVCLNT